MARLQTLPYIDIQHDALAVFDDVSQGVVEEENVWVSCYKIGESSVHGKMKLTKGDSEDGLQSVRIQEKDGVKVVRRSHTTFTVEAPSLKIKPTIVRFPRQALEPPSNKEDLSAPLNINALAVSPSGTHLVYGGPDGYLKVEPTSTDDKSGPVSLKGHVGDLLAVKWFPSGEVILSASSDSTIRIHSSKTAQNPRTLTGHKRAVTSLHILGVGKNVLSGSKDGSLKLWNVGEGKSLVSMYVDGFKGVECMAVGLGAKKVKEAKAKVGEVDGMEGVDEEVSLPLPGEVEEGTADQVVFVGTSSGTIAVFDLASKTTIYSSILHLPPASSLDPSFPSDAAGGAIHSIAYDPVNNLLASGSSKGTVVVRSTLDLSNVLQVFRRTESAINDLAFVSTSEEGGVDLVIAPDSGLPCKVRAPLVEGKGVEVVEEYAGWEAVPVESVSVGPAGMVWLGGAEAGVRRY